MHLVEVLVVHAEMVVEPMPQFRFVDVQHAGELVQRIVDVDHF